jgi:hypothetical protein
LRVFCAQRSCGPPLFDGPLSPLVLLFASLLAAALAGQRLFYTELFARLKVKRMPLYLLDDVFLLNFALETAECVFQRLALLQSYFCQN